MKKMMMMMAGTGVLVKNFFYIWRAIILGVLEIIVSVSLVGWELGVKGWAF